MNAIAQEYTEALSRPIKYDDVPFDQWRDRDLKNQNLPNHVYEHFLTMAKLHADNRYDRLTEDVLTVTGKPAMSIREFVTTHPDIFRKAAYERTRS